MMQCVRKHGIIVMVLWEKRACSSTLAFSRVSRLSKVKVGLALGLGLV